MQTFLPYKSFERCARVLDRQRLGKQRIECVQILNVLLGSYAPNSRSRGAGWSNHPAALMWRGYERALYAYLLAMVEEWAMRGYDNAKTLEHIDRLWPLVQGRPLLNPPWLGGRYFHWSHQSNLLRKDAKYYGQFGWIVPHDLEYIWPVTSYSRGARREAR